MLSTKSTICLLVLCLTAFSLILGDDEGKIRTFEVTDKFLQKHKKHMKSLFGKAHLSLNHNSTYVSQVQPFFWGEHDHVILMLEVKHFGNNCSISRNVVFLLDTGAFYTVISPALRRLILKDCKLVEPHTSIGIKINGRQTYPRTAKDYYADANILGMDYMKANNIEFSMKINRFRIGKSILKFQFDTEYKETTDL